MNTGLTVGSPAAAGSMGPAELVGLAAARAPTALVEEPPPGAPADTVDGSTLGGAGGPAGDGAGSTPVGGGNPGGPAWPGLRELDAGAGTAVDGGAIELAS
jgi:hypothetical protein